MLSKDLSDKVLTIGCEYDPPRGGVAQVMYTYSKEVYPIFHCITNSGRGGKIKKLWKLVTGWVKTAFALLFCRNIKIVHIHTASYNSFKRSVIFISLAKFYNKKVVLHIHGGGFKEYYKTNQKWIKKKLLQTDYVITLTDAWRQYYHEELRLPHVVKVNNIITTPQIETIEKNGKLHFLFLGAINEQKGIFDLLEIINEHKDEFNNRIILHIGGNQEVKKLKRYIQEKKLSDLIKYEGWVSGDKKNELLNESDAFILPSYVEGLPISILESLSYGKPVISTYVGGIPEVVNDDNGYLFTPGDRKALYDILSSILIEPSSLKDKSNNALASVKNNLPDCVAEVLGFVYNELLNQ